MLNVSHNLSDPTQKSLNEIKDKLQALGLTLGMTFEPDLLEAPKEDAALPILH